MYADFKTSEQLDYWIRNYLEQKKKAGPVVFLDSQLEGHSSSGFGYIASDPQCAIRYRDGDVWYDRTGKSGNGNGYSSHSEGNSGFDFDSDPETVIKANAWDALKQFRDQHPDWMFGWLGYDLKNDIEPLESGHPDPVGLPDLYFFVPGTVLKIDRKTCRVELLKGKPEVLKRPEGYHETGCEQQNRPFHIGRPVSGLGWQNYHDKVLQIKEFIARGDTYEVNLTHQLQVPFSGHSLDLFAEMSKAGPVPFAAWMHYGNVDVCCSSPERFLKRQGLHIVSQPIKGTSARGATPDDDRRIVHEILQKEKNRAENVMIVDLVRHDLGQVAKTGTVRADSLLQVQTFSTVHQLVSSIRAELKAESHSVDVLKACFPMGSMTGAPKIRTMQIIEEMENYRRGLYSGAIGYFTPEGDFDFNVVIRTAIVTGDRLYYSVGGAVTADSDPREEWEESWLKAEALPYNFDQHKVLS